MSEEVVGFAWVAECCLISHHFDCCRRSDYHCYRHQVEPKTDCLVEILKEVVAAAAAVAAVAAAAASVVYLQQSYRPAPRTSP